MALAVYLKTVRGKIRQDLPGRYLLALSATWGGTLNWNRRNYNMYQPTEQIHTMTGFMDKQEEKLFNLMEQKNNLSTKLYQIICEERAICEDFTYWSVLDYVQIAEKKHKISLMEDQPEHVENDEIKSEMHFREIESNMQFNLFAEEEEKLLNMLTTTVKEIKVIGATLGCRRIQNFLAQLYKAKVAKTGQDAIIMKFRRFRQATQYYDFIVYLFKSCKFIEHTNSSEEILQILKTVCSKKFNFLGDNLLKQGISYYLKKLRFVYFADLRCKFGLWLLSSNIALNQINISTSVITWESFFAATKNSPQMKGFPSQFSELCSHDLRIVLHNYLHYKKETCGGDDDKLRFIYEERFRKFAEDKKELIMQFDDDLLGDSFRMVYHTRKEGYCMDIYGDPETEVRKLEELFEEIQNARPDY